MRVSELCRPEALSIEGGPACEAGADCGRDLPSLRFHPSHSLAPSRTHVSPQLLVGLAYLEQQGVAHADLKPDNLVVDTSMSVLKICDFGSALHTNELGGNEAEEAATSTPYLQSRFYRAPEVILGYPPRGPAMDMWSAGTTMYELYTARVLFPGRHNNEVLRQMMEVRG